MTGRYQEQGFVILREVTNGALTETIITDPERLARIDAAEEIGRAYARGEMTAEQAWEAIDAIGGFDWQKGDTQMAKIDGTPDHIAVALAAILATNGLKQRPEAWPVCEAGWHDPNEVLKCEIHITYCAECGRPKHYSFAWDTPTTIESVYEGLLKSLTEWPDEDDDEDEEGDW